MIRSVLRRFTVHAGLLCSLVPITATAAGQAAPEDRTRVPMVEITEPGEGTLVLLRWRPAEPSISTIMVSSRNVLSSLQNGRLLADTPEAAMTTTKRPPLEYLWTVQGSLRTVTGGGAPVAQWRVLNGAVRLHGVEPEPGREPISDASTVTDADVSRESKDDDGSTAGVPPDAAPTDQTTDRPRFVANLERSRQLARIQDDAASRTAGASIAQRFTTAGIVPGSGLIQLEQANPRVNYEVERLLSVMRLAEPLLPDRPVGVGASWTARWTTLVQRRTIETVMTWTLDGVDEAAVSATGVAETAVLSVEYTRRALDAGRGDDRLEGDGRGRLQVDLRRPMRLDATLVEVPPKTSDADDASRVVEIDRMRIVAVE